MATQRGRNPSLSPAEFPDTQLRSPSRGRDRDRSRSLHGRHSSKSRARSQGEEINYRWSILTHDPYERFEPKQNRPEGAPDIDDDFSEEEQISDDEPDTNYDIMNAKLPNFYASINDIYKKKQATDTPIPKMDQQRAENQKRRGSNTKRLAEALALEKALEDAKEMNSEVPSDMAEVIRSELEQIGYKRPPKTDDLVKLENSKEKATEEYTKFVVGESKKPSEHLIPITDKKNIVLSDVGVNAEDHRASRSITLGDFFADKDRDPTSIRSFIIYVDQSSDALVAIQYTIGCLVKSGDVIYVIHTSEYDDDLDYFTRQVDKFSTSVTGYMKNIYDQDFKLHVLVESTYRKYTKHFLDQLLKYLKPSMFVIAYSTLASSDKLSSYVSPCPFIVVKKKNTSKS